MCGMNLPVLLYRMFVLMFTPFGCSEKEISACIKDGTISLEHGI